MNISKCCSSYVCASSGHKQACERHDFGAQCGVPATNIAAQTTRDLSIKVSANSNQQNFQKTLRQLEVVSSPAIKQVNPSDDELDLYQNQPAAFVPSKVPRWRTLPYMNICIPEHQITPHMIKVNLMAKFNTLPDKNLNDIEKFLDI